MRRISGASIAWFSLAAAMFAGAIVLTMMVTWVRGGTLERGRANAEALPRQYMGVLLPREAAPNVTHSHILYREQVSTGDAEVTFSLLGPVTAVLLVSGLQNEDSCSVLVDIAQDQGESLESFNLGPIVGGATLYGVVAELDSSHLITCQVEAVSRPDTFTTRRMWMEAVGARFVTDAEGSPDDPQRQAFIEAVRESDFQAQPSIRVDLDGIEGAENMRFAGSFETQDDIYGGTWRTLTRDEFMIVSWDDIYSKQMRDVLLIVIGTLIGVGVTVLIEGLRPMIEAIGKQPQAPAAGLEPQPTTDPPIPAGPPAAASPDPIAPSPEKNEPQAGLAKSADSP